MVSYFLVCSFLADEWTVETSAVGRTANWSISSNDVRFLAFGMHVRCIFPLWHQEGCNGRAFKRGRY
jgi:hypothetical protein